MRIVSKGAEKLDLQRGQQLAQFLPEVPNYSLQFNTCLACCGELTDTRSAVTH